MDLQLHLIAPALTVSSATDHLLEQTDDLLFSIGRDLAWWEAQGDTTGIIH